VSMLSVIRKYKDHNLKNSNKNSATQENYDIESHFKKTNYI
jgi:hypothetical protein